MWKIFRVILITLALATLITPLKAQAKKPGIYTFTGTYYDYMCIVTQSGKEILLPDKQSENNQCMKWNQRKGCYMPIFKSGQKVKGLIKYKANEKNKVVKIVMLRRCSVM